MKALLSVMIALATPGLAQSTDKDLFAELALDLNGNGIEETYSLHRNEIGDADLLVRGDPAMNARFPSLVFSGAMFGTTPSLGYSQNGSLQILSGNDAVGRGRWSQVLTVAWRNDRLTLAGYTYTWFDTLDRQDRGTCDVNLMTGRGVFAQDSYGGRDVIETEAIALPLSAWNANRRLAICTPIPTGNP